MSRVPVITSRILRDAPRFWGAGVASMRATRTNSRSVRAFTAFSLNSVSYSTRASVKINGHPNLVPSRFRRCSSRKSQSVFVPSRFAASTASATCPEFECGEDREAERHLPKPGAGGFARGSFVRGARAGGASIWDVYESGAVLGRGAFGSVHSAKHRLTGETVAVKVVQKHKDMDLFSIQQEVQFMKVADHPNIIRLYETFENDSNIYFVMENATGGELWKHVLSQHEVGVGVSEQELASLMEEMFRAVAYCHAHCIVHRDLKPQNFIFISPLSGSARPALQLVDFGVSGIVSLKVDRFLTKTTGTDGYMAPEVLKQQPYGPAADLFSLGAVMHALVTGVPPCWNKEKQAYMFPGKIRWRMMSEGAQSLLARLLDIDPEMRPSASEAMRDAWIRERSCTGDESAPFLLTNDHIERVRRFGRRSKLQRTLMECVVAFADQPASRCAEMRMLKNAFIAADKNGDGEVEVSELSRVVKCETNSAEALLKALDESQDGTISYLEWLTAGASNAWFHDQECTRRAFDALDADGDGHVSIGDLQEVLPGVFQLEDVECLRACGLFPLSIEGFEEALREISDGKG